MKFLVISIAIVIHFNIQIFSQWIQQNSGTSSNLFHIQFLNADTGLVMGYDHNIYKTTTGGAEWNYLGSVLPPDEGILYDIYFVNDLTGWLTAYNIYNETGSIYKTTDGGENWWMQFTDYYTSIYEIQFVDSLIGYAAAWGELGTGFVYKTTDGGDLWTSALGSSSSFLTSSLNFINKDTGWVAGTNILKTVNGGVSWQEQLNIEPNYFTSVQFINDHTGWASSDNKIYKTTNGGNSWFQQAVIEFAKSFFVDTLNGWLVNSSAIFHTSDGGDSWNLQISNTSENLNDIFFTDQMLGWVCGTNGTILNTINGGTPVELVSFSSSQEGNDVVLKWQTATETNNQGFEVERKVNSKQYAVSSQWENIGSVTGNGTTTKPKSYLFTDKNVTSGIYKYRLKQIDFNGSFEYSKEIEAKVNSPLQFFLSQNYPNPFNPITTIKYSVPKDGKVKLTVYNTLGQEVAELLNKEVKAGNYEVEFNASGLASGVYFYQMKVGDYTVTKKLILLK